MRNIFLLILLLAIFLLSSCIVSFKNPLTEDKKIPIDNRLLGKWENSDKKDVLFEFKTESNLQTFLYFRDEKENEQKLIFEVFSEKIGDYYYLTLQPIEKDDDDASFLLIRYKIQDDEMTAWLPDKTKFNELIEQGKLKGNKKAYGEIYITNSASEMKKFLESPESDEFFEFFGKLKKQ